MSVKMRYIRFLDKGTGVVSQTQVPAQEEWTSEEVKKDYEKDVDFIQILEASHEPIPGLYGKIMEPDPKYMDKEE